MDNLRKCSKCKRMLPKERFSLKAFHCRDCVRAYNVSWRKNNPEKEKERCAKWRKKNIDKCRAYDANKRRNNAEYDAEWSKNNYNKNKERRTKWLQNNPGYYAKYDRERRIYDYKFRVIRNIRSAITAAISGRAKLGHTKELLGCSIDELRNHLECLFQPGMTWDNYGKGGWHIDHIIPLSYFDMSDPEQQKRAWHYTNLQPLWAKDNLRKSNKILERQLILI